MNVEYLRYKFYCRSGQTVPVLTDIRDFPLRTNVCWQNSRLYYTCNVTAKSLQILTSQWKEQKKRNISCSIQEQCVTLLFKIDSNFHGNVFLFLLVNTWEKIYAYHWNIGVELTWKFSNSLARGTIIIVLIKVLTKYIVVVVVVVVHTSDRIRSKANMTMTLWNLVGSTSSVSVWMVNVKYHHDRCVDMTYDSDTRHHIQAVPKKNRT